MIDYTNFTYEQLAHALYMKGLDEGYSKITDKTGWRENVMGEILGHKVYKRISSGAGTAGEGSDAKCKTTGRRAEYKTKALEDKDLRNLFQRPRSKNRTYAPLKVSGVYNNAMKPGAVDSYSLIDHYFGVFYREECVMIIKVDTSYVTSSLREAINHKIKTGSHTTNLCSVSVSLGDKTHHEVVYRKESFFADKK